MRTVGVEEELLVVDPTGVPVALGPATLRVAARSGEGQTVEQHDRADGPAGGTEWEDGPHLVPELKQQQIELATRVCSTLADVGGELRHWRARADAAAATVGARVAALASSPVPVQPLATPGRRYTRMAEVFGLTAAEVLTCGCHVHVSVDGEEEGIAVLDRIRVWLPVLTALTANSPFWSGRDTGYASFRSQVWSRWPSAGPTALFGSPAAYHELIDGLLASGTVLDSGMVYFDARLSATWPTVEVRVADVALRVEDAVLLAALVRGLVETAVRDRQAGHPAPDVRAELVRVAAWRAGRSGTSGVLVHPHSGRAAPAAEVVAALVDHVGPALTDSGDLALVRHGVAEVLRRGTGADLQRRVLADTGDPAAVVRAAVAATHGG